MKYNFVRTINDRQVLLVRNNGFFIASQSMSGIVETLVFRSNAVGVITDWNEIDGASGTLKEFMDSNVNS